MPNVKSIENNNINKHKNKKKELKVTLKGRHVIKPKKLLTTSSDEKMKRKKRILKHKSINMHDELNDLQSCASQPNILRDITLSNKVHTSKPITSKTSHTSNVLSHSMDDINLLHNNHNAKQSLKYDTTHAMTRNLTGVDYLNTFNDQNLQQSVEHDRNDLLSKNCSAADSNVLFNNQNLKCSVEYDKTDLSSKDCSEPDSKMSFNKNFNRSVEHDTSHSLSKKYTGGDSNMSCNTKNLNRSVEHDTSHSLSRKYTGGDSSMSCNIKNSKLSNQNNKTLESSGSINGLEESETSLCEIIKLLRQVIEQNTKMLSDIKTLKGQHITSIQNNLYKKPDGFPLKTVEEFKQLETDKDRLQELVFIICF